MQAVSDSCAIITVTGGVTSYWLKAKAVLDPRETESTKERMLIQPPHLSPEGMSPD